MRGGVCCAGEGVDGVRELPTSDSRPEDRGTLTAVGIPLRLEKVGWVLVEGKEEREPCRWGIALFTGPGLPLVEGLGERMEAILAEWSEKESAQGVLKAKRVPKQRTVGCRLF